MSLNTRPDLAAAGLAFVTDRFDRRDDARGDAAQIAAWRADETARMAIFHKGRPLVRAKGDGFIPVFTPPAASDAWPAHEEVFLGLSTAGPVFARALVDPFEPDDSPLTRDGQFLEMWRRVDQFSPEDADILGVARGLLAWHARHRFCANCGAASRLSHAGWRRTCPACETEHYPRVDPVSIMLIVRGEQILLGRQANFPPGVFSCLAGFVEPGETLEAATRREAFEEAGVRLGAVTYMASQPWPFPSSFMLGVRAEALSDDTTPDGVEIEEVRWFDRAEARALLTGSHPDARVPPPFAIAHQLIRMWAEERA